MFLLSLQSFYFPAFGGSVLCYAGLLMLLPLMLGRPVVLPALSLAAVFYLLIGIRGFSDPTSLEKGFVGTALGLLGLIAVPAAFADRRQVLAQALRIALTAHAVIIFVQAALFFSGFGYVDLLKPFGLVQSVMSQKGVVFGVIQVPRFAGLFNEPGSYSSVVMAMLAAEYALSRRFSWVTLLVLASVAATVSLGGMVLASVFLGAVVWDRVLRRRVSMASAVGSGIGLASFLLYLKSNFEKRAQLYLETGMLQDSMLAWALNPKHLTLLGVRAANIPFGFSQGYVGVWLDVLVFYGALGLAATGAFVVLALDLSGAALAGVILLAKLKFTYPLVFALLGAVYCGTTRSHSDREIATALPSSVG